MYINVTDKLIVMHGLWRLNIESQCKYQNYKWHTHEYKFINGTHMNLSSISISTQIHQFICYRHALHCVLEGL